MQKRGWLILARIGVALVVVAMAVSWIAVADKRDFGWMVGAWFLPIITGGVFAGGILLLIAASMLRVQERKWRRYALIVWALIAITSPLFGIMFLFPWGVLVLSLPVVVVILAKWPHAVTAA